jgi:hypothetical protein
MLCPFALHLLARLFQIRVCSRRLATTAFGASKGLQRFELRPLNPQRVSTASALLDAGARRMLARTH